MGTQAMYCASQGYNRDRHSQSIMHTQAMKCEPTLLNVEHHGGIQQAFQRRRQVCLQKYQIKDLNQENSILIKQLTYGDHCDIEG